MTESGCSGAFVRGLPFELRAVRRAEVGGLGARAVPQDLDVLAGRAGVLHGDVGVAASADDRADPAERAALAVDLDDRLPLHLVLAHVARVDAS